MSWEAQSTAAQPVLARRPAAALALCFIAGIAASPLAPVRPVGWFVAAAVLVLGGIAFNRWSPRAVADRRAEWRSWASATVLACATLATGLLAGQLQRFCYPPGHIAAYTDDAARLARVRFRLDDPPRLIQARHGNPRQATRATVTAILTTGGWEACTGQVVVQLANSNTPFAAGQSIESLAWLRRPEAAANPGQFDWADYYRQERIVARLDVPEPGCARVVADGAPGAVWPAREYVRSLLARGFSEDQSVDHALLRALLLGDNDPQLRDVQDLFVATGTSHHLAISGMHVSLLGGVVYLGCRLVRMRPRRSALVVMAFVVLYGVVALPSPPVLRSILLCALVLGGVVLRRSVDVVQLLSLSVFAMLAIDPMDLFAPGFQLSFLTVLGLIVLTPWVDRKITDRLYDEHDRVAATVARPGRVRRAWHFIGRHVRAALVAAVVAWVVSLPLILLHFDRLNPWAIFGSIVLAPIVFVGLMGGLLKVLLTLLVPPLAGVWAGIAGQPMVWMRHVVDWLALLPGSDVPFPAPPVWMLLAFYVLLALPLVPWRPGIAAVLSRAAPAGGLALVLAPWPLALLHSGTPPLPCLRLTVLSVGAGSCAVLESPDGAVAVVDAGSSGIQALNRNILRPFLHTRRISRIDHLFVTAAGADHHNAVDEVLDEFPVHEVIVADAFQADAGRTPSAAQFLASLQRSRRGPRTVSAGDRLRLGRDVAVDVLWPPPPGPHRDAATDHSVAFRVTYAGRSLLFTGDIDATAQRALINGPGELRSDVLLAPDHGTASDMTPFFVNEVNPSILISSNDRTRTARQVQFEATVAPRPLYRTDRCGAIMVTIDASGRFSIETFRRR